MKYTWLRPILQQYRLLLTGVIFLQLGAAILTAAQPLYLQKIVATVIDSESGPAFQQAVLSIAVLLALYMSVTASQVITGILGSRLSANLLKQLQMNFLIHSANLPVRYFRSARAGEFITRFNHDIGQVQNLLVGIGPQMIKELLTSLCLLIVLVLLCPLELVAGVVLVVATAAIFIYWLNGHLMSFAGIQRQQWSGINHSFNELVRGIETIKAFSAETKCAEKFEQETKNFQQLSIQYGRFSAIWSPTGDLLIRAGALLPLLFAFVLLNDGGLGVESFLIYFFCVSLLMASVSSLVNGLSGIQPMLVALSNLASYFELGEEDRTQLAEIQNQKISSIEFNKVSYGHIDNELLVKDFSAIFKIGMVNTLSGNNGAGKTTLIEMLFGFSSPSSGTILVNGFPVQKSQLSGLRKNTALVASSQYLFEGSIRKNLLFAADKADDKKLKNILDLVGLEAANKNLTLSLDYALTNNAGNLSDGERQKLIIARALLSNAGIVIFDEPLAHIDRFSESKITDAISLLAKSAMVVVISHRGEGYKRVLRIEIPTKRVIS